ncbi:DNA polymerase III subunit gamma and tau [Streptomyces sp. J2-1]|uniref:DNA polymerase III subunit gamma and tau n=1 Tax=Streptomyces corallincola TaxID=2851888 RepID=UPI001C387450|nr:DNA polymerase III subunit gamma and tau [Streptomyces corallincola]MBV2358031.1 DNA polymerase III subunit gamma and tau [Streptomyces corallincola]
MSSLALYRRYRPESFAEVIGQEHVTDPLSQALRNNRVNHAYLFSGPRGCGKTTSARILARCLNCEQGPTPTPCGECQSCQDLARNGPGSIDVIEIDAASHGGVDDARDLREKAFFGPAGSRYKIYIIDEAHMVTSAGFNALLKVVEEPPEHLKFIFATTEPEKVIGTIRSRTHHYPFRLVPPGTLREYLGEVCGREAVPVEEGVLPLVVRAGAGSVRDSMSVMDQLLAGAGADGVTYGMATSLLGYTDGSLLDSVVEAFATGDGAAAFEVVDRIIEGGNDPRRFVADLLERLRDLVILAAVPDAVEKGLIDAPADVLDRMQAQASTFGPAELSRAADLLNDGLTEMRGATSPRLQLELICARVLLPAAYGDERSLMARLDRLERGVNFSSGASAPAMGYAPAPAPGYAPGPAMGYAPGPDAHGSAPGAPGAAAPAAPVPPGGGPAAARAAVRGAGAPEPGGPGNTGGPGSPGGPNGHTASPSSPAAQPPASAPASAPAQHLQHQASAPTPAAPSTGGPDPRVLWPNILEAVKNRRRFTWILLSQNAQIAGFDGTTLQLGFVNAGARDNFASSGSEDVLKQALSEQFHVQWKIESVVDPSGGGAAPPPSGGPGGYGGGPGGYGSGTGQGYGAPAPGGYGAPAPGGTSAPAPAAPAAPRPSAPPASPPRGSAPAAPAPVPAAPPVSIEDDIPEDDDPDLHESALSGYDLIVRELGATVVEEFNNE